MTVNREYYSGRNRLTGEFYFEAIITSGDRTETFRYVWQTPEDRKAVLNNAQALLEDSSSMLKRKDLTRFVRVSMEIQNDPTGK